MTTFHFNKFVNHRHRHLLADLHSLLPHSRKDAKLDTKTQLTQLNELADLYNCNNIMFFEARKGKDLYIWLSKPPNGPTVKMHCQNVHTMEELNFTGNCLKGSRPVLSFDASFEKQAHLRVLKELLTPIVMLEGSFGGPVIYENKEFVSPNQVRADLRRSKAGRYNRRAEGTLERKVRRRDLGLRSNEGVREVDELDERVLFR